MQRAPAWTTDWISAEGQEKLRAYGIAPPGPVDAARGVADPLRAARRSRRSPARAARARTPSASPPSARPPARRSSAAAPAASRSNTSSRSDRARWRFTSIRCASRACAPRPTRRSSSRSTFPPSSREQFRFTQGQHLTLKETIAGSEQRRSYSICAGVDDGELRVGIRKVPGGVFSTWLNETLQGRRHARGDDARGALLRAARRRARRATTSASPAAAASRRSCRS